MKQFRMEEGKKWKKNSGGGEGKQQINVTDKVFEIRHSASPPACALAKDASHKLTNQGKIEKNKAVWLHDVF